jgi:hypothetical protein
MSDDDDTQDYVRPWVGLTKSELDIIFDKLTQKNRWTVLDFYLAIEAKLKEKNSK